MKRRIANLTVALLSAFLMVGIAMVLRLAAQEAGYPPNYSLLMTKPVSQLLPGNFSILQLLNGKWIATSSPRGVCLNGVCNPITFGAFADAARARNCSIAPDGTGISCSTYAFQPSDIGKVGGMLRAGTAVNGGVHNTLLFTISTVSAGVAGITITGNGPATEVSGNGVVVFGHDDGAAINAAGSAAGSVYGRVDLANYNYISTVTVSLGGTTTAAHALSGNSWKIYFLIPDFTSNGLRAVGADVPTDVQVGQDFYPIHIDDGEVDCLDTGLDCLSLGNSDSGSIRRLTINNAFRNGLSMIPQPNTTGRSWIEQLRLDQITIMNSGHHCVYEGLIASGDGFNNDQVDDKVDCRAYGLNSARILAAAGGPAAPWSSWSAGNKTTYNPQLGAAWYMIATQPQGYSGFECRNCTNDAEAVAAQAAGSQVNPAAVVLADGQIGHLIEGAGSGLATNTFLQFLWTNLRAESVGGFGTQTGTNWIWAEDAAAIAGIAAAGVINPSGDASYVNTENFLGAGGNFELSPNAPGGIAQMTWAGNGNFVGNLQAKANSVTSANATFNAGSPAAVAINSTTFTTIMGAINGMALVEMRSTAGHGYAVVAIDQYNGGVSTLLNVGSYTFQVSAGALQVKSVSATDSVQTMSVGSN